MSSVGLILYQRGWFGDREKGPLKWKYGARLFAFIVVAILLVYIKFFTLAKVEWASKMFWSDRWAVVSQRVYNETTVE